jgi:chemotaxis protein methyltransferase CheR
MAVQSDFALSNEDFRFIADTIHRQAGILLADHKRNLVYSRLTKRLRALSLPDFKSYCDLLKSPKGVDELGVMINALTTNLTSFFREAHHFEHLRDTALPETVADPRGHGHRIRIWSSACSTGEEPYSIAMTIKAAGLNFAGWDLRVLATDLDTTVLQTAMEGVYDSAAAQKLPKAMSDRFTEPLGDGSGRLRAAKELRPLITFKHLNLLGDWPMRGPFDVIFCRNVLIYFDAETKTRLIDRFVKLLRPGGWLYLGHSETLTTANPALHLEGRTTYRRVQ